MPCVIVIGFEVHWSTWRGGERNFEQKAGFPVVQQFHFGLCFGDALEVDPDLCDELATSSMTIHSRYQAVGYSRCPPP